MQKLQISFEDGTHGMTVDEAVRIHKDLGLAVIVDNGRELTFQYEGGDVVGSPTNNQRGI